MSADCHAIGCEPRQVKFHVLCQFIRTRQNLRSTPATEFPWCSISRLLRDEHLVQQNARIDSNGRQLLSHISPESTSHSRHPFLNDGIAHRRRSVASQSFRATWIFHHHSRHTNLLPIPHARQGHQRHQWMRRRRQRPRQSFNLGDDDLHTPNAFETKMIVQLGRGILLGGGNDSSAGHGDQISDLAFLLDLLSKLPPSFHVKNLRSVLCGAEMQLNLGRTARESCFAGLSFAALALRRSSRRWCFASTFNFLRAANDNATSHSSALRTLVFWRFQQHWRRHGCSSSHRLKAVTLDVTTTDVNQLRTRRVSNHNAALQPITVSCAQYTQAIIRPAEKSRKRGHSICFLHGYHMFMCNTATTGSCAKQHWCMWYFFRP